MDWSSVRRVQWVVSKWWVLDGRKILAIFQTFSRPKMTARARVGHCGEGGEGGSDRDCFHPEPTNQPTNRPLIYSHLVGEAAGRDHRVPSEMESGDGELHFTPDPQNRHLRHVRKIFRFLDTLPLSANSQNFSYKAFFDFFAYPPPPPLLAWMYLIEDPNRPQFIVPSPVVRPFSLSLSLARTTRRISGRRARCVRVVAQ